ncbi:hypothetical protein Poli38472_009702 [Pythium oligandrum]|uniref:Uncharacterized protein n=1 Tax=Pythium oligandrum TaxID=41045 RepID=A0A8K1CFR1_PYTOL|nr:hypothetical protein Poli38472_009702 [Pythium oligandrum]|eukprot:TMW62209.1 hypothetical protein Poli38472_009702 [Pythium oligandrum]
MLYKAHPHEKRWVKRMDDSDEWLVPFLNWPCGRQAVVMTKDEDTAYVAVPPTPQGDLREPARSKKKLTLAEKYALEPPFRAREHPLHTASLLSAYTTDWFQPIVALGYQKVLEKDDIWPVCPGDTCDALEERFKQHYDILSEQQTDPATRNGNWWVSRFGVALLRTFRMDLFNIYGNYALYVAMMVLQPFIAQAMLDYLNDEENIFHIKSGVVLVFLMTIVSLIGVSCLNYGFFVSSWIGANMRSIIMDVVYQKALRLSSTARQKYTTGEIVTLMSVDAERIFGSVIQGPWILVSPLAFVITIVVVAILYGIVPAVAGAVVMVLVLFCSVKLGDRIGEVQLKLLNVVEERVKVTSEALQGIRVMKFYAWEDSLARRVEKMRSIEVGLYRRFHYLNVINISLLFLLPMIMCAVIFGIYAALEGTISVTDAFVMIAMVNISRYGVNQFPLAIANLSQAKVAFRRLDTYMESDELGSSRSEGKLSNGAHSENGSISIRDAHFIWTESNTSSVPEVVVDDIDASTAEAVPEGSVPSLVEAQNVFSLEGVNLEVEPGSLVMIVGTVGSGKTSLLNALLGEMKRMSGVCDVNGEIAFVSQESWIRNASMKENILFETPFDPQRYEQVLEATQLALDLHALPNGDQTEIGERGINLSGGQKARVTIARAMYRENYDILILDDPLSAVDPHVAHAIFNECILGLAKDKTRLLVLNSHYDLLPHADKILVVQHGRIVGDGKYGEILAQFPDLGVQTQKMNSTEENVIDEHESVDVEKVQGHAAAHAAATAVVVTTPVVVSGDEEAKKDEPARLVQEEDRVKGKVSGQTYRTYFDETGYNGVLVVVVLVLIFGIAQTIKVGGDWWQGYWAKQMPRRGVDSSYSDVWYICWYIGLIVVCTVVTLARGVVLMESCMRSAKNLHDELFRRVLNAPVNQYFDITPVGRILNRFSNDLDQVDSNLPQQYHSLFQAATLVLGCLVVCGVASFWIALSYIPMIFIFVITGLYYKRSSREIKRLEGITRTPIFNLFSETLNGLDTIRAFQMEDKFVALNKVAVDDNASFYFNYWGAGRWLSVRLDWLSVVIIFVVSLYIILSKGSIAPTVAGLSITYSLMLTSMVQWCIRAVDLTDNAMTSVERLLHFRTIPAESNDSDCTPINPEAWPSTGSIQFDNLCLKYRPELPLVLRGVSMDIAGGEKVGICGRTGAGKSSLMIALFRITEFESGSLFIDGVDISQLKLRELRRSLAIIPQDPVLFSGSLRENLDPYGDYSDEAIWNVLKQVHLADAVTKWGAGLEFIVSERGDNLSVGQRQLVCIGRALLKDSKIVVLDEATANVDSATDNLIQATIKETFRHKTVLIIAHRINTIMHCDKIAVMDAGKVAEFGSPAELLRQSDSIFSSLAQRSAGATEE